MVLSLHKELLKYSTKDERHRGKYKQIENTVGILNAEGNVAKIIFETTPAWLVAKEIKELVDWTYTPLEEKNFHPLLVKDICREIGISDATFYNWKAKYGGMEASDVKRLKELEAENAQLKSMYAEASMENRVLKSLIEKKF